MNQEYSLPPATAYDLWAPSYETDNPLLLMERELLAPHIASLDFRGKTVADFGCGTGRYADVCSGAEFSMGVDISPKMLKQAASRRTKRHDLLINARLESLPFRTSVFDLGICVLVLGYLPQLDQGILEMSRTLRQGGRVFIADLHPQRSDWKRTFALPGIAGKSLEIQHYRHSPEEYRSAFSRNGFMVEFSDEPPIGPAVEHVFETFGKKQEYRRSMGTPLLLTFILRKI